MCITHVCRAFHHWKTRTCKNTFQFKKKCCAKLLDEYKTKQITLTYSKKRQLQPHTIPNLYQLTNRQDKSCMIKTQNICNQRNESAHKLWHVVLRLIVYAEGERQYTNYVGRFSAAQLQLIELLTELK